MFVKNKLKYCRYGHVIFVSHCKFRHRMATDEEIQSALIRSNVIYKLYYKSQMNNNRWKLVLSGTKKEANHWYKFYKAYGISADNLKIKEVMKK